MITTKYRNTLTRTEWNWEALLLFNKLPKIHNISDETDETTLRLYYKIALRQISEIKEYLYEVSPDTRKEAMGEIRYYFRDRECTLTLDEENEIADEFMFYRATAISCYEVMYEYLKDLATFIYSKKGELPLIPDFITFEHEVKYYDGLGIEQQASPIEVQKKPIPIINEVIWHEELKAEYEEIKEDVHGLNNFAIFRTFEQEKFNSWVQENQNKGTESNLPFLIELLGKYINKARLKLSKIQQETNEKVINILAKKLEPTTLDMSDTDIGIRAFSYEDRENWKYAFKVSREEIEPELWKKYALKYCTELLLETEKKLYEELKVNGKNTYIGGIIEGSGIEGEYTDEHGVTRKGTTYQSNFEKIPNKELPLLQKAATNIQTYISELENEKETISNPTNEVNKVEILPNEQIRPKMKIAAAAKAVYHSGLLLNHTAVNIAKWIVEYCDITTAKGKSVKEYEKLSPLINNAVSAENKRGLKFQLKVELKILEELYKLHPLE